VVRPLLDWTRQDTADFCRQFALPIWEDSTNQDTGYARNRIRLEVMPQLKQHFNPAVENTLAQTAELLTAEVDLLEQLAQDLYDGVVQTPTASASWRIQRQGLKQAHVALQRRVMRRVLQQALPAQVSFEAVEKLVALINAPNRTQTDPFGGGLVGEVEKDWIILRQSN
jgi:tRNA(Ile)-lysidine synthase